MKIFRKYILLIFFILPGCYYGERVEMIDANIMIFIASSYREQKCGERPVETLIVISNPTKFAVDACSFTLMRDPCPFTSYPLVCLELYDIDVPFIGPDLNEYPPEENQTEIFPEIPYLK